MSGLENLPPKNFFGEDIVLTVHMEGRKRTCFKCGKRGQLRSKCSPPQKEQVQEENTEEVAPLAKEAVVQKATVEPEPSLKTDRSDTISRRNGIQNGVAKKAPPPKKSNGVTERRGGPKNEGKKEK